eukprot:g478.t1
MMDVRVENSLLQFLHHIHRLIEDLDTCDPDFRKVIEGLDTCDPNFHRLELIQYIEKQVSSNITFSSKEKRKLQSSIIKAWKDLAPRLSKEDDSWETITKMAQPLSGIPGGQGGWEGKIDSDFDGVIPWGDVADFQEIQPLVSNVEEKLSAAIDKNTTSAINDAYEALEDLGDVSPIELLSFPSWEKVLNVLKESLLPLSSSKITTVETKRKMSSTESKVSSTLSSSLRLSSTSQRILWSLFCEAMSNSPLQLADIFLVCLDRIYDYFSIPENGQNIQSLNELSWSLLLSCELLVKMATQIPSFWSFFPIQTRDRIYIKMFILLRDIQFSKGNDSIQPSHYLAAVDPDVNWFAAWCSGAHPRAQLFSYFKSTKLLDHLVTIAVSNNEEIEIENVQFNFESQNCQISLKQLKNLRLQSTFAMLASALSHAEGRLCFPAVSKKIPLSVQQFSNWEKRIHHTLTDDKDTIVNGRIRQLKPLSSPCCDEKKMDDSIINLSKIFCLLADMVWLRRCSDHITLSLRNVAQSQVIDMKTLYHLFSPFKKLLISEAEMKGEEKEMLVPLLIRMTDVIRAITSRKNSSLVLLKKYKGKVVFEPVIRFLKFAMFVIPSSVSKYSEKQSVAIRCLLTASLPILHTLSGLKNSNAMVLVCSAIELLDDQYTLEDGDFEKMREWKNTAVDVLLQCGRTVTGVQILSRLVMGRSVNNVKEIKRPWLPLLLVTRALQLDKSISCYIVHNFLLPPSSVFVDAVIDSDIMQTFFTLVEEGKCIGMLHETLYHDSSIYETYSNILCLLLSKSERMFIEMKRLLTRLIFDEANVSIESQVIGFRILILLLNNVETAIALEKHFNLLARLKNDDTSNTYIDAVTELRKEAIYLLTIVTEKTSFTFFSYGNHGYINFFHTFNQ